MILIQAVLDRLLPHPYIPTYLQPSGYGSDHDPKNGEGWGGVMRWCREVARDPRSLADKDMIIVHLDADVASKKYADAGIDDWLANDLPCEQACPPAQDTVTALEKVVTGWLGNDLPARLILCIPSRQSEAWLVPLIYQGKSNIECSKQVYSWLSTKEVGKLCRQDGTKKDTKAYRRYAKELTNGWDHVKSACVQAAIFEQRVLQQI